MYSPTLSTVFANSKLSFRIARLSGKCHPYHSRVRIAYLLISLSKSSSKAVQIIHKYRKKSNSIMSNQLLNIDKFELLLTNSLNNHSVDFVRTEFQLVSGETVVKTYKSNYCLEYC